MKKFLLSLSAVLTCMSMASAATITIKSADAKDIVGTHYDKELKEDGSTLTNERWQPLESLTIGDYEFSFTSPESGTATAYYNASTPTIRIYKGGSMTISSTSDMAQIVMSGTAKSDPNATSPQGKVTYATNKLTWTGDATKLVTINFEGNVQFATFEISDIAGGGGDEPGDSSETGTAENPLSVTEFLALGTPSAAVANTYVKGFIVGYIPAMTIADAVFGATGEVSKTNILLAADADCKDYNLCIPVQIPSGSLRDVLTLAGDPSILGKEVTLLGSREKYFGVNGLKSVTKYAFAGSSIEPEVPAIYSGLASDATGWDFYNEILPEELTYVWQWDTSYKNLKGSAYYKQAYAAEAWAYSPVVDLAGYSDVKVSFEHAANYQTTLKDLCGFYVINAGQDGAPWLPLTIQNWPPAGSWTFTDCGAISLDDYKDAKVRFGFKYASSADGADTWEIKNFVVSGTKDGAVEVIFDSNAPVIYYDLNGRIVNADNLQKGIYIMRQGNKVTKVIR